MGIGSQSSIYDGEALPSLKELLPVLEFQYKCQVSEDETFCSWEIGAFFLYLW